MYNCLNPRRIVVDLPGSKIKKDGTPGRRVRLLGDPDIFELVRVDTFCRETGEYPDDYIVPCGKCVNCRRNQKLIWSRRLQMESACYPSDQQIFLTLTYDDLHVPLDHRYSDFQNFIRKFRRSLSDDGFGRIRYFMCAEKGDLYGRCHFHAIIFGYDPWIMDSDSIDIAHFNADNQPLFSTKRINNAWSDDDGMIGFAEFSPVSDATLSYVAGYVTKKLGSDGNLASFCRMSLKPGIGYNFIRDHIDSIRRDHGFYLRGKFIPVDRYCLRVLEKDFGMSVSEIASIKLDKAVRAQSFKDQYNSSLPQRINDRRLADAFLRHKKCGSL